MRWKRVGGSEETTGGDDGGGEGGAVNEAISDGGDNFAIEVIH